MRDYSGEDGRHDSFCLRVCPRYVSCIQLMIAISPKVLQLEVGQVQEDVLMAEYLGTLKIEPTSFKQTFTGRQLGPNEVLTKCTSSHLE